MTLTLRRPDDMAGVGVAIPHMTGTTPLPTGRPVRILGTVPTPDAVLAARLRAGDDRALTDIYRRHGALVFGVAQRTTGSRRRLSTLPEVR